MSNIKHEFYSIKKIDNNLYNKLRRHKRWWNIRLTKEWFNIDDLVYIYESRYFSKKV